MAGPKPAAMVLRMLVVDQRSSCSTLACDWLASASAETAIDWRVDSAWLLATSWLVSASVRLDEPVCSTLIRVLEKSGRISTTDRFEPSDDASDRSVLEATFIVVTTLLVAPVSMKSTPDSRLLRPRPAELNVTPLMLRVDLPVSLNTSLRITIEQVDAVERGVLRGGVDLR